jgi:hypothetical protein
MVAFAFRVGVLRNCNFADNFTETLPIPYSQNIPQN